MVDNDFKEAVDSGDLLQVYIMLKDSMMLDTSMKLFNERLAYAESNLDNLFDEHDGEVFDENIDSWTEGYISTESVNLIDNFSKERIKFLQKMIQKVYGVEETHYESKSDEYSSDVIKYVGAGTAAVGAATTVVGIALIHPVVIGIGVTAAVVGGAVYYYGKTR